MVELTHHGGGTRPPVHYHPSQTERFEVLDGTINAVLDGEERTLETGDELVIPPSTEHEMWSEDGAKQRWEISPALRTERFFETYWGMQQDGKIGPDPPPLQMALTVRHFAPEIRLASPPAPVQAVAFPVLAQIARLRGLEPEYRPQ